MKKSNKKKNLVYFGKYDKNGEPVLLKPKTKRWLYELCDWLNKHQFNA